MIKKLTFISALMISVSVHAGWTPPMRISDEATAYNPRIVANGDTLHVAYWTSQNRSFYIRSEQGGSYWEGPLDIAFGDDSSSTLSPLPLAAGDTIAVVWRHSFGFDNRVNWGIRTSLDGGVNWGEILFVLPTHNYELRKYSACSSVGVLHLMYSRWSQGLLFEFTRSADRGETWSEPTEVFRTQETGRIDMAARGDTIHFVWAGRFNYDDEWEIYYIRSTDSGESWSENIMFSAYDEYGSNFPTISINSMGNIAVCWMDYKYSPYLWTGDLFVRYSFDSGDSWTEEDQLTFAHGAFANRILWQRDSIHIAWEDWRYSQRDIFYMLSTDDGLTWGDEMRVEDNPQASGFPDIAVVGDSRHLVWYDRRDDLGNGIYYSRWEEEVGIDDREYGPMPGKVKLTAHPNPFNGSTTITYCQLEGGDVEIYNIRGQKIRTLTTTAKEGKLIWDARDALGNKVSSGVYFARVRNGSVGTKPPHKSETIKLLYLK